jgi:hypothetical protein
VSRNAGQEIVVAVTSGVRDQTPPTARGKCAVFLDT